MARSANPAGETEYVRSGLMYVIAIAATPRSESALKCYTCAAALVSW